MLVSLLLMGCYQTGQPQLEGDTSTSTDRLSPLDSGISDNGSESMGEPVACPGLDFYECAAQPHCHQIVGLPIVYDAETTGETMACVDEPQEFSYCRDRPECEPTPVIISGPTGQCWYFGDSCVPRIDGWDDDRIEATCPTDATVGFCWSDGK